MVSGSEDLGCKKAQRGSFLRIGGPDLGVSENRGP